MFPSDAWSYSWQSLCCWRLIITLDAIPLGHLTMALQSSSGSRRSFIQPSYLHARAIPSDLREALRKIPPLACLGFPGSQFSLIGELQTPDPVSKSKTEN